MPCYKIRFQPIGHMTMMSEKLTTEPYPSEFALELQRLSDEGNGRKPASREEIDDGFRDFSESLIENIDEVFFWSNPGSLKPYFVSHAYERIFGWHCESAYSEPSSWLETIHPEDRDRVLREFESAGTRTSTRV